MVGRQTGRRTGTLLVGLLLVAGGAAAFSLQAAGFQVGELVGRDGWPFLVIVPGLALLAGAAIAARPAGVGLAIAGSIVTTVGAILLYQNLTKDWESWAYVWALIPTAAGVALAVYGTAASDDGLVLTGGRLALIGAVLFLAGLWFFGSLFSSGTAPFNLGEWWPAVPIVIGGAILLSAIGRSGTTRPHQPLPR